MSVFELNFFCFQICALEEQVKLLSQQLQEITDKKMIDLLALKNVTLTEILKDKVSINLLVSLNFTVKVIKIKMNPLF